MLAREPKLLFKTATIGLYSTLCLSSFLHGIKGKLNLLYHDVHRPPPDAKHKVPNYFEFIPSNLAAREFPVKLHSEALLMIMSCIPNRVMKLTEINKWMPHTPL